MVIRLPNAVFRGLRRYSGPPKLANEGSALAERFEQLLESKIAAHSPSSSIIDEDPKLAAIYRKYQPENDAFQQKYQKELLYAKSEPLLKHNKHARAMAQSPWTGSETQVDSVRRMLEDAAPKPMKVSRSNSRRIFTPPVDARTRIELAKEASLDYKVTGSLGEKSTEEDKFRELYRERLLGPSMFLDASSPSSTVGLVDSLADARINAAIDRKTGKFESPEMLHVRGKPLDRQHLANSTDTNYFMNEILSKQEILPPWIESQQTITASIKGFRKDLDRSWFRVIFDHLKLKHRNSKLDILASLAVEQSFFDLKSTNHNFETRYLDEKVKHINSAIRDYNLQCPLSNLHKMKILPEREVSDLYHRIVGSLSEMIEKWYTDNETAKTDLGLNKDAGGGTLLGLFDGRGGGGQGGEARPPSAILQRPTEKLELWKSFKEMFLTMEEKPQEK